MTIKIGGEVLKLTDGTPYNAMIRDGEKVLKAKCHKGHEITYVEINLEEYDKRVHDLALSIAKLPGVDLVSILKDALYDLSLDYLQTVEGKIKRELSKPKPEIKTKVSTTYRGTCVNLSVGGKNLVELRH